MRRATQRELYAGTAVALGVLYAHAPCKTNYGVYVETLRRNHLSRALYVVSRERSAYDGEYVAVLALLCHPLLVVVVIHGLEGYVHANGGSLEKEFLHDLPRTDAVGSDKDAETERGVDVSLSDVENLGIVARQYFHDRCRESRMVLAGYANKYLLFHQ